jgi:hypothetical protein
LRLSREANKEIRGIREAAKTKCAERLKVITK